MTRSITMDDHACPCLGAGAKASPPPGCVCTVVCVASMPRNRMVVAWCMMVYGPAGTLHVRGRVRSSYQQRACGCCCCHCTVSGGGLVVRLRSHASWYLLQSACRPPRRGGREGSEVFNSLSIDCMAYHGEVGMEFFRVCSVFLEGSIEISHSNLNPTCATIS